MLIQQLAQADAEHSDVSVQTATGMCLSLFGNGLVVIEDLEGNALLPHWCHVASPDDAVHLMHLLTADDLEALLNARV